MIEDNWIQYLQVDGENALKCQNVELMGLGESTGTTYSNVPRNREL